MGQTEGTGERATALVVHAENPLDNRIKRGKAGLSQIWTVIGSAPNATYVTRKFELNRDRWPVRGMELPVSFDPANPSQFEVRWDEVPSIEDRAASNDPTLADPVGTRKRTMEAVRAALGADAGAPSQDPDLAVITALSSQVQMDEQNEDFAKALEEASAKPAPDGKTRALVMVAATEATLKQEHMGDVDDLDYYRDIHGKHAAVLAVTVPGGEPYAVFMPKFKHPSGKGVPAGGGLPAVVSSTDPSDVEVLWDELLSVKEQYKQTATAAMQQAQNRMAGMQQQAAEASQRTGPPAAPAGGWGAGPQITPEMKQMMIQNAKMALANTPPQMRPMLIQQYRMAGIEIDDEGNIAE
jgi:hypothetical protein